MPRRRRRADRGRRGGLSSCIGCSPQSTQHRPAPLIDPPRIDRRGTLAQRHLTRRPSTFRALIHDLLKVTPARTRRRCPARANAVGHSSCAHHRPAQTERARVRSTARSPAVAKRAPPPGRPRTDAARRPRGSRPGAADAHKNKLTATPAGPSRPGPGPARSITARFDGAQASSLLADPFDASRLPQSRQLPSSCPCRARGRGCSEIVVSTRMNMLPVARPGAGGVGHGRQRSASEIQSAVDFRAASARFARRQAW